MRLLALLATVLPAIAHAQGVTIITNVSVIPMDRSEVLPNRTVVIEGGRITEVRTAPLARAGATMVNGAGKFLMPGLTEMHAHVPSGAQIALADRALSLYVLAGVTTARGMLGAPMHLAVRDSIARGQRIGPRLFTSGPSFNNNSVTSVDGAIAMVRAQKEAGYDLLKIHPGVPRVAFDSLAATANRLGITFSGHVPLEIGLDVAITSKYSTIDHLDGFIEAMCKCAGQIAAQADGFFGLALMPQIDPARFQGIVDRVKASGVSMVPTQILMDNYTSDETGDALTSRPEMKYWVTDGGLGTNAWRAQKNNILANPPAPKAQRDAFIALRRRFITALHAAGVPFLLGSDAPQIWNVPGFSAHRELQSLVLAGLTPYQALQTGTVNVAKYLKEEGKSGVVRVGARADLILLDANPLTDVENTMKISGVVANGRWISADERERMLAVLAVR